MPVYNNECILEAINLFTLQITLLDTFPIHIKSRNSRKRANYLWNPHKYLVWKLAKVWEVMFLKSIIYIWLNEIFRNYQFLCRTSFRHKLNVELKSWLQKYHVLIFGESVNYFGRDLVPLISSLTATWNYFTR